MDKERVKHDIANIISRNTVRLRGSPNSYTIYNEDLLVGLIDELVDYFKYYPYSSENSEDLKALKARKAKERGDPIKGYNNSFGKER